MNPQILVSPDLEVRVQSIQFLLLKNKLNQTNPDVLYFQADEKLGIESIRKIRHFLAIKPLKSTIKVVVIESAHNLTPDAQNSLLKTLEEPATQCLILLGVESLSKLLPTVISRCQIKHLSENRTLAPQKELSEITQFLSMDIDLKFEFIEKTTDKSSFLEKLISFYQSRLYRGENPYLLSELLDAQMWISQNGNSRATLEYIALCIEKSSNQIVTAI